MLISYINAPLPTMAVLVGLIALIFSVKTLSSTSSPLTSLLTLEAIALLSLLAVVYYWNNLPTLLLVVYLTFIVVEASAGLGLLISLSRNPIFLMCQSKLNKLLIFKINHTPTPSMLMLSTYNSSIFFMV